MQLTEPDGSEAIQVKVDSNYDFGYADSCGKFISRIWNSNLLLSHITGETLQGESDK